jgi:hypothetical protein
MFLKLDEYVAIKLTINTIMTYFGPMSITIRVNHDIGSRINISGKAKMKNEKNLIPVFGP